MFFCFRPLRFTFQAIDQISIARGAASNTVRGVFGLLLKTTFCDPQCWATSQCDGSCVYAQLFKPIDRQGPSGLRDSPRPFVLRANELDGRIVQPGECFSIDLYLFDRDSVRVEQVVTAWTKLREIGIGKNRGKAELMAVQTLDAERQATKLSADRNLELCLGLTPPDRHVDRVEIAFLTPTELKGGDLDDPPSFSFIYSRLRDRLLNLSRLYGCAVLAATDFKTLNREAQKITLVSSQIERVMVTRLNRTDGTSHPLGGIVGPVTYNGSLRQFWPLLIVGTWIGVGKHTVWGRGALSVRENA